MNGELTKYRYRDMKEMQVEGERTMVQFGHGKAAGVVEVVDLVEVHILVLLGSEVDH